MFSLARLGVMCLIESVGFLSSALSFSLRAASVAMYHNNQHTIQKQWPVYVSVKLQNKKPHTQTPRGFSRAQAEE
jgi:hypothetical protein